MSGIAPTLVHGLRRHAAERGSAPACAFLADGVHVTSRVSFADLDRDARACAAWLQARCRPNDRVLLLYHFQHGLWGTHSPSPNFGYELCIRKISEAEIGGWICACGRGGRGLARGVRGPGRPAHRRRARVGLCARRTGLRRFRTRPGMSLRPKLMRDSGRATQRRPRQQCLTKSGKEPT